jgi:uncharacterized protein (DUF885 family)
MLNYEDYFNDLIKISSQASYIFKKTKVFKHYTNTLSDDYINKLKELMIKYSNTTDIELKKTINFLKKSFSNKLDLYLIITPYENQILTFDHDNEKIYPSKYKEQRQADFHEYVKTIIMRLDEGLKMKITIPYIITKKLILQLKNLQKYKYFYNYLKNIYLSKCTKKIGLCNQPNGKKIYKLLISNEINKTPEYIHKLGLSLLPKKIIKIPKADYYKSKDEFFKDCEIIALYIYNNIVDKYFYYKPDKPFTIKKVPTSLEEAYPVAYYNSNEDIVFINLKYYNECTKKILYPLLMHECFHQYHYRYMNYKKLKLYQIDGYSYITMIEGFAHYMEIYCDDNDNDDGNENDNYYSILRKIRLVADTGINYYNWSYKKTFNFMLRYLPSNTKDIISEIDRYICLPGQALCYVIGKLEIISMRNKFLKQNKNLTIKDFHEKLLINGTCSLSTIKKLILI